MDIQGKKEASDLFFGMFSYPLTPFESWKYQWESKKTLGEYIGQSLITEYPASDAWTLRKKRWRISLPKIRKALRAARIVRHIPFVRGIAIANTLSYYNARPFADVDMFVIYEGNHGWVVRFFCLCTLLLFGRPSMRKKDRTTRSPLCFSFYLSASRLDMRDLALHDNDVYLAYWVAQLMPIYGSWVWSTLWHENAPWVGAHLPMMYPRRTVSSFMVKDISTQGTTLLERVFSLKIVNSLFAHVEWAWLPLELKMLANKDTRVMVKPDILKFHRTDKREYYLEQWKSLLKDSF